MLDKFQSLLTKLMALFLGLLAVLIIIYMAQDLWMLTKMIIIPAERDSIEVISEHILAFFMLFEFIMMLIKYIEDSHHIPTKYLILISMTAILRQLLVVHNNGWQTLLLTVSILILTGVLYILKLIQLKGTSED
ncbi:phosphate-starvation-inducible PsiE family protein [Vagococcus vulneris]|uniref:Protein PsiE n=1 Tax=Vagococcus vulneris TaxID=1977869 RepID=A0A429ZZ91_9ENTE|nr:phosphate-starvation-inducible PsiE family protein [Vagococcus vulneris]RST99332.1 hypothetical protein CBF37_05015 [Vagococcus vulneris]